MKIQMKRMLSAVIFLTVVLGLVYHVNGLLRVKGSSAGYSMEMFYEQAAETVDVLNIGSSHMFANVNPAILWEEYGIAAYNIGASQQPVWNTYYYLKEALKYQRPRLIVMDVFGTTQEETYLSYARAEMNLIGLRRGKEYVDNIKVSIDGSRYTDFLMQLPVYHNRYDALTEMDFLEYGGDVNGINFKGYALESMGVTQFGGFVDTKNIAEVKELPEKCYEYLIRTIELAASEEIPLLLVVNPYMGIMYEEKKLYNRVAQIAQIYGIDYIDFNDYYEEIGFDPETDFAEAHHLNYYGSEKFSSYYGNYIKEHYVIPDRRGQAGFESWEANSQFYRKQAANVDLAKTIDEAGYLEKLFANQERYTICFCAQGDYYRDRRYVYELSDRGYDLWNEHYWVVSGGDVVYCSHRQEEEPFYYQDLGRCAAVLSEGVMYLGNMDSGIVWNGLNILVYDNELETIVDVCGIDAYTGELIRGE